MMKKYILSVLLGCSFFFAVAQTNHKIQIQIAGQQDSMLLLTSYYGEKIYLVDSAKGINGMYEFNRSEELPAGMYMAVSSDKEKLFEFLVNDVQSFNLYTDTSNYIVNMKVHGSPENKAFFDFVKHNTNLRRQEYALSEQLRLYPDTSYQYQLLRKQYDSIGNLITEFMEEVIQTNKGLFVAELLNAMKEVKLPDSLMESGNRQSIFKYYKDHYWDDFNLSDPRLLRTPLISQRVDQYFSKIVLFHPDSVIAGIDLVISKARPNKEMVSWLVWHFISKYQNPEYMGFDKVFVHMVDEYTSKEEIDNTTPSIAKSLQERADQLRPILLGEPAPNLILIDTSGAYYSFQSMLNDYIVLFFWDYDCGICTTENYHLQQLQPNTPFDIGVYAINVNSDLDKWKEAIDTKKMSWVNVNGTRSVTEDFHDLYDIQGTPNLIVLDKKRNIIAKNIAAEKIGTFLENYSKMEESLLENEQK